MNDKRGESFVEVSSPPRIPPSVIGQWDACPELWLILPSKSVIPVLLHPLTLLLGKE